MEGLSLRTVIMNAFCQLIIVLYLFDNDTSWVVLFSAVTGTAIEFWKVKTHAARPIPRTRL
jgi:hypothetical protein